MDMKKRINKTVVNGSRDYHFDVNNNYCEIVIVSWHLY